MSYKRKSARKPRKPKTKTVTIELEHPGADSVAIVGSFNGWRPQPMDSAGVEQGRWATELSLPPGRYEYLLVVDGRWLPDPNAEEGVPNPYGGSNSVLHVS